MARFQRAKLLGELQDLVGRAKSDFENDRAWDRAERVTRSLDRAFDIVLTIRNHDYPRSRT